MLTSIMFKAPSEVTPRVWAQLPEDGEWKAQPPFQPGHPGLQVCLPTPVGRWLTGT